MKRFTVILGLAALSLVTGGCKKEDAKGDDKAASAAKGCGSDYADPLKEFCVKVPAGYEAKPQSKVPTELYSEIVDFNGPGSGFAISVGFSHSNFKTFDEALKTDEEWMTTTKDVKIQGSGNLQGTGKWWTYKRGNYDVDVKAMAKSNGNKVINCAANNQDVKPEVLEACKTVRAYPK